MSRPSIADRGVLKTNQTLLNTTFGGINPLDLSHEAIEFDVVCRFPINGQYGFLQRVLYYCILVFALFVRNHDWLAAGSLVSALTYSGVAAIHSFLLVANYKPTTHNKIPLSGDYWGTGDPDLAALFPILSTACLIAIPLMTWSSTLRRLKARPIIVYWMILVAAGALTCFWRNFSGYYPYLEAATGICTYAPGDPHWEEPGLSGCFWTGYWTRFNCTSQCSNRRPDVFLRRSKSMVPNLLPYDVNKQKEHAASPRLPWQIVTIFIAQGIYAIFSGRKSPSQVRDSIFSLVSGKGRSPNRFRITVAAATALSVYLLSLGIFVGTPIIFILFIYWEEYFLLSYPVEATPSDVDQWSPWISTSFVIFAAIIARYHDHLLAAMKRQWKRLREITTFRQRGLLSKSSQYSLGWGKSGLPRSAVSDASLALPRIFPKTSRQTWYWTKGVLKPVLRELSGLFDWLRDPVKVSALTAPETESNNPTGNSVDHVELLDVDVEASGASASKTNKSGVRLLPLDLDTEIISNAPPLVLKP